jgi:hypothetical protein
MVILWLVWQGKSVQSFFSIIAINTGHSLSPAPLLTAICKVDHIMVMGLGGAVIHLLAADVWKHCTVPIGGVTQEVSHPARQRS